MDAAERYERHVGKPGYYQHVTVEETEGNHLVGPDGTRYIDFIAGWCVVNAGYGRDRIIDRMTRHAEQAAYTKPTYIDDRTARLAERLADLAPGRLRQTFRVPSGTEAVEIAIKAARRCTGSEVIVSNQDAYHGTAYGAMSAGRDSLGAPFEPLVAGFEQVPVPDGTEAWYDRLAETFAEHDVAAYLTETILTHQGVTIPAAEHYGRVRELCDEHDVLLVLDEVANGFGRTGELFAADIYDAEPDIMALAKGMSSGYAPIGATLTAPDIGDVMSETAMSAYSTFGWVPSAVGAADANLDILQEDGLAAQAGETGRWMADRIRRIDGVSDVRQAGLVLGVQLTDATADAARSAALEHGLLVGTTNHDDVLLVAPPLNIDREYAGEGVERLADSIAACDA